MCGFVVSDAQRIEMCSQFRVILLKALSMEMSAEDGLDFGGKGVGLEERDSVVGQDLFNITTRDEEIPLVTPFLPQALLQNAICRRICVLRAGNWQLL
jgi:hypothetical protein